MMSKVSVDQRQFSNLLDTKCNGILCMFIGLVQDKSCLLECSGKDCTALLNWLKSENNDVNKESWQMNAAAELEVFDDIDEFSESYRKMKVTPSYWATSLSKMLPILLKCNGNLKFVDENGKTILHVFLETYVSQHIDDITLDDFDNDELMRRDRIIRLVEYLMVNGLSAQIADANGNTPLHHATKLMDIDLIKTMLKDNVNVNASNKQGDTILHLVAENSIECDGYFVRESCELAELMLSKGADVNQQNKNGWTPVHFAAKHNHLDMLKVFAKRKPNLNLRTNDGENVLLLSCKFMNNADMPIEPDKPFLMKQLIKAGADFHCRTKDFDLTPLHIALNREYKDDAAKLLTQAGADIDAEAADGVTPLHLAIFTRSDVALYLIQKGANINCREVLFGFTLMHMAAMQCDKKNLEMTLSQELNVNDGGNYGITALHLASFLGNVEIVKLLIAHGADVNYRDDVTHSTALHFAAKSGKLLDFISNIGGVKRKPYWRPRMPLKKDTESVIALLVQNGASVNAKDASGRTALHLATVYIKSKDKFHDVGSLSAMVYAQEIDSTRGLLKCGAHTDVQDDEGNLPLHNALKSENEKALKSLLTFGVDVNEADTVSIVLSCKKDIMNQVLNYVGKLKAVGLPVSSMYSPYVGCKFLDIYYDRYMEEENMKSHFIDNTTSLYNLLHMNWRQQINLAQSVPMDLQKKFPRYYGIIQSSCREALERKLLYEPAKSAWYGITEVYLPDICVERILDHLKNRYLRVLVDGVFNNNV